MNAGPVGTNGGLAGNRLAREADVVLCVGTRMGDFVTASRTTFQNPEAVFISLNIASMDAHKQRSVPIVADAREGLRALEAALAEAGWTGSPEAHAHRAESLKAEWDGIVSKLREPDGAPGDLGQSEVIGIVNDGVGGDATVICAAGSLPGDLLRLWRAEDPKAYHVEYGFSCMGYEIVAGLGVRLADPDRDVVVMVGDGSYLMMNSEIVTAVAEGLKLTIVVLDNHGFQCILALQRLVGVPDFGNELRFRNPKSNRLDGPYVPIDFRKHAEAMGALAIQANTATELRAALETARTADGVTVIVVPTDPEKRLAGFESWWDVPVAAASSQAGVRDARKAYDAKRADRRSDLQ
jgi:3D-(3,5/4)-trihydroxycyclohexane-1,2-dione acylhydrolase (decyclizing)